MSISIQRNAQLNTELKKYYQRNGTKTNFGVTNVRADKRRSRQTSD